MLSHLIVPCCVISHDHDSQVSEDSCGHNESRIEGATMLVFDKSNQAHEVLVHGDGGGGGGGGDGELEFLRAQVAALTAKVGEPLDSTRTILVCGEAGDGERELFKSSRTQDSYTCLSDLLTRRVISPQARARSSTRSARTARGRRRPRCRRWV